MTDEEIRIRCLELVYDKNIHEFFDEAESLFNWVIQIREISNTRNRIKQNTVTFEKINPERKE